MTDSSDGQPMVTYNSHILVYSWISLLIIKMEGIPQGLFMVQHTNAILLANFLQQSQTMSSNTNSNTKKKRRVDEGGSGGAAGEHGMDCTVHQELKDIKSTMNEMMEHSRLQTQNMTNMMRMMQGMQGEITRLTEKCIEMKYIMYLLDEE